MDYQAQLYDPIYDVLGVPAMLEPKSGFTSVVDLTVIDKTAGVEVTEGKIGIQSIYPAAVVRMAELAANGVALGDLDQTPIAFNGRAWRIRSHRAVPSPHGEGDGERLLILTATS